MHFSFARHSSYASQYHSCSLRYIYAGHMPVAWIGNVIAISTLQPTLGDTFLQAKDIFVPVIPVALFSWGISSLLGLLSTEAYLMLLPFVVSSGSMVIILCPWPYLTMKNLMLVVFYIVVASPLSLRYTDFEEGNVVQEELDAWFVPGLLGTCIVGLCVALLVHLLSIPLRRSTAASRSAQRLVRQLACESSLLLRSVSEYTSNIGRASSVARQARTLIEFYAKSRGRTLERLEGCLPAMRAERSNLRIVPVSSEFDLDVVEKYVSCARKQQKHAELLMLATTQQFLGEEFTSLSETVRDVKVKISTNLGFVVEQLALEYARSERAFFLGNSHSNEGREDAYQNLQSCMEGYRKAMRQAIIDAENLLLHDDAASRSTTGPLIRQRVAFLAVFSFVHELRDMIARVADEEPANKGRTSMMSRLVSTLKMPWLWADLAKRRLATKTAVGLCLSSLWVSIPYLRGHVAYPNSCWVGITVASVSLESTGGSWVKCLDRLWGTLVAGAFSVSFAHR